MSTEKKLKAMTKDELKECLEALGKELEQDFPTSGTNDELRERIVTAREMLALKQSQGGDNDNPDNPDQGSGDDTQDKSGSGNDKGDDQGSDEDDAESYFIRAKSKTGFYRCGKFWPHEGRKIKAEMLSDDQLSQLKAETNLIIE